ncbi:MAG: AbrB/MazE/SpoVT family DNA-binding domain-containing protein [Gemmatimonadetes bacterium]|nr:AbrB/MazE/SpoVT family DNA-binding domain-containing protein [Gemmatimonadota bacterium]
MPVAKKTSKNQLTLPKVIVDRFPGVDYFDVREEEGRIILSPVVPGRADEVRSKLAELGLGPGDIEQAIRSARGR